MSFSAGGAHGMGGMEQALTYMIRAYDLATPVFKAFRDQVNATTRSVQTSMTTMNRALVEQDKAVTNSIARQRAALGELSASYERVEAAQAASVGAQKGELAGLSRAYETTGVKAVDAAKMQAEAAKEAEAATTAQADAAQVSAERQVRAASTVSAASAREAEAVSASASKQARSAGEVEAAAAGSSKAVGRMGRDILLAGAAVAGGSLDMATKFNANTLRMRTQAGATATGLDQIRKGLLAMAGQVGATPNQLANGMYHVVSSMNAVLPPATRVRQELQIMKVAAEGAQVGHSNLEETTYALASALNAMHQSAGQASNVMGQLNAIVGAGDMTMTDLIDSFKSGLIPAANSFGLSLQSVGAALSVMGDMGMRGALAGTRLRMAISLLGAPSQQAAGILETLGMKATDAMASTQRMSDLLRHAGVTTTLLSQDLRKPDGLQVALQDLDNHLKSNGLSADGAAAAISRAFGGGRMGAAITLMAENTDRLRAKFNQIGSAGQQFGTDWQLTARTFRVELDKAGASIEALGIKIGNWLLPYATAGLHDLEDMANWLSKNQRVLEALGVAFGTFATVAIGTYFIGKVSSAINKMKEFGSTTARFGSWLFGVQPATAAPEMAAAGAAESAVARPRIAPMGGGGPMSIISGGGSGGSSSGMGLIWGYMGSLIRVGTMSNPMAVTISGAGMHGGAINDTQARAQREAGIGPAVVPSGAATNVAEIGTVEAAASAAAAAEIDRTLTELETTLSSGTTSSGRMRDPATGRFVSAAAAAPEPIVASLPPAGVPSVRELQAAEEQALRDVMVPELTQLRLQNPLSSYPAARMAPTPVYGGRPGEPHLSPPPIVAPSPQTVAVWEQEQRQAAEITATAQMAAGKMPQIKQELSLFNANLLKVEEGLAVANEQLGMGGIATTEKALGTEAALTSQVPLRRRPGVIGTDPFAGLSSEERFAMMYPGGRFGEPVSALGAAERPGFFSRAGGFLSTAGSGLMRGGLVAGMGVLGSQMVGSMIPGQAGHDVQKIGTLTSIGAGLGTLGASLIPAIGPVVGPLAGAITGGLIGSLTELFKKQDWGKAIAGKVTAGGFGGPPGSPQQQNLQTTISGALNQMAKLTEEPRTVKSGGRIPIAVQEQVHVSVTQLSIDKQAQYMRAAKTAGQAVAGQLEAGWSQYRFQSEPIMFTQLRAKLKDMPPAAQAFGVQSAVKFAQSLEAQGKLTKGSAEVLLGQAESAFPQFAQYLGLQADAGVKQFNKALDFSHAEDATKKSMSNIANDFPQVRQAMDETQGDTNTKAAAMVRSFESIIHGPDSTDDMKKRALADLHTLRSGITNDMNASAALVAQKASDMASSIKGGGESAANTAQTNFTNVKNQIISAMASGAESTAAGVKQITDALNATLTAFGAAKVPTAGLSPQQALQSVTSFSDVFFHGQTSNTAGAGHRGLEGGGFVGTEGEKGLDTVHAVLGRGEAVLKGQDQAIINRELARGKGRYNSISDVFAATAGQKHYMASGGIVGMQSGGFAGSGPTLNYSQLEGLWNEANPSKTQLAPLMAAIAMAESSGQDVVNSIGASGYWQILGVPFPGNPLDPLTNAKMAGAKLESQGLGAWVTYTSGAYKQFMHGNVPPGLVSGLGVAPTIPAPKVTGSGTISKLVQSGLNKVTDAANQIVSQETAVMSPGGAPGPQGTVPAQGGPPAQVQARMMAAASSILGLPYIWGGGHGSWVAPGYDCSGAVSYVLHAGGLLSTPEATGALAGYGDPGPGRYITIGVTNGGPGGGHTMMNFFGRYFESGGGASGPHWDQGWSQTFQQYRHPAGYATGGIIDPQQGDFGEMSPMILLKGRPDLIGSPLFDAYASRRGYKLPVGRHIRKSIHPNGAFNIGGRINPEYGGAFAHGGELIADRPTIVLMGENGPEHAIFSPMSAADRVTYSSGSSASGASHTSTSTSSTVVSGGERTTTTQRISSGVTSKGTPTSSQSTTVTTSPVAPKAPKVVHYSWGFDPFTDQVEYLPSTSWTKIHAEHSKQVHDAAAAQKAAREAAAAAKKKLDAYLAQPIKDPLTVGKIKEGELDLTRKQAIADFLPSAGAGGPINLLKDMNKLTEKVWTKIVSELTKTIAKQPEDMQITVANKFARTMSAVTERHLFAEQGTLQHRLTHLHHEHQTKRVKAAEHTTQKHLTAITDQIATSRPAQLTTIAVTAALKSVTSDISTAIQDGTGNLTADIRKLTQLQSDANKTHNTKTINKISSELTTAYKGLIDRITQNLTDANDQIQGSADLITAVQGLPANVSVASLGLSAKSLKQLNLSPAQLQSFAGGANPMQAAQTTNTFLAQERTNTVNALNKIVNDLPKLHGTALTDANTQIKTFTQSIATLTTQINTNLINAIKASAQVFQDQADQAAGAGDILQAIGNIAPGTNLSSLGITPGLLSAIGVPSSIAGNISSFQGSALDYISGLQQQQSGTLTAAQIGQATSFVGAENQLIQQQIGSPDTGLVGELNYDVGQLPGLSGTDRTGMLATIQGLVKTIAGLDKTMHDNTTALASLTTATNANTSATGQMTGTVGYQYQGQNYIAGGISSDETININVGS